MTRKYIHIEQRLAMEGLVLVLLLVAVGANGHFLPSEREIVKTPVFESNTTMITVFHVNQANYSVTDITNMNTANLHGDMYFALRSYALPQECGPLYNESFWSHLDCSDAEVDAKNLAVT